MKKLATAKRPTWSAAAGVVRSAVVSRYGAAAFVGGRSSQAYLTARVGY